MKFWKDCNECRGRGEVLPSHPFATSPANMTGEIVDRTKSVCRKCHGSGLVCKVERDTMKVSREVWAEQYDQQSRVTR